jgi:hypothetical protein
MLDNEVMVRFALTKAGENLPPNRSEISNFEAQDFRHCIQLNICWEPFVISDQYPDVKIVALEVLYDGCTRIDGEKFGLYIDSNGLSGYPAPVVCFQTNQPVTNAAFTRAIRETDVSITTSGRSQAGHPPFFAEDHNGYSGVIEKSLQKDWIELIQGAGVLSGYRETFPGGLEESGYSIAGDKFIVRPISNE